MIMCIMMMIYMYQNCLKQVSVEVCEVDQDLVKVAETWFGFKQHSERMTVHIEDGVQFVHKKAASAEGAGKLSKSKN